MSSSSSSSTDPAPHPEPHAAAAAAVEAAEADDAAGAPLLAGVDTRAELLLALSAAQHGLIDISAALLLLPEQQPGGAHPAAAALLQAYPGSAEHLQRLAAHQAAHQATHRTLCGHPEPCCVASTRLLRHLAVLVADGQAQALPPAAERAHVLAALRQLQAALAALEAAAAAAGVGEAFSTRAVVQAWADARLGQPPDAALQPVVQRLAADLLPPA